MISFLSWSLMICHTSGVILNFLQFVSVEIYSYQETIGSCLGVEDLLLSMAINFVPPIFPNSVMKVLNGLIIIAVVNWILDSNSFQQTSSEFSWGAMKNYWYCWQKWSPIRNIETSDVFLSFYQRGSNPNKMQTSRDQHSIVTSLVK